MATLPAVQAQALVLHELQGFSVEEVARMQSVSPSAVKSRLARGRQRLRRFYETKEGIRIGTASLLGAPPAATAAAPLARMGTRQVSAFSEGESRS